MSDHPFMSVVVISHNGESTVGATIESLLAQTYPRDRFEIIVVNDGSSDKTVSIIKRYEDVHLVNLKLNRGISGARNAGLEACQGDVYVAFDDDCIAHPDWLAQLAAGYAKGNPVGVGGRLVEPEPVKGITSAYIGAGDANLGAQLSPAPASGNPLHRLRRYVSNRLRQSPKPTKQVVVNELYGANGSFPVPVLRQVEGWREQMSGVEDRDLSLRIRRAFPNRPFYIMPDAVIEHDRGQTLIQYLLRSYKRGPVNLAFHRSNGLIPPVFPFPFLFAGLTVAIAAIKLWLLIPAILILPQLLYFWWSSFAIRRRRFNALLFPYIQLAEESLVLAGLAKGYAGLARRNLHRFGQRVRHVAYLLVGLVCIGLWVAIMLATDSPITHSVAALPFILLVPGYFCLQLILGVNRQSNGFKVLSYSIGLSLLLLMLTGLGLNELYILLGWQQPLTLRPLVAAISTVTSLFAIGAYLWRPREFTLFPWRPHRPRGGMLPSLAVAFIVVLLPLLAAAGAITLNNGGSAFLAGVTLAAIGVLVLVLAFTSRELGRYYGWLLGSICAALLLGTSLRGWNITGHDVLQEYQVFQLTLTHATWHMSYYRDAYMACLSITILPTIFQKLTGISDPYIFKLIFQLIFALVAPIMYMTLRNYLTARRALLATVIFLFFPTFITDIMMLNRQEIALIFFALSLAVGLDREIGMRARSLLGLLFLIGMILAHYSTSYIAIAALLLSFGLALAWRTGARAFKRKAGLVLADGLLQMYRPTVVVAALLILIGWGTFVTQSSDNAYRTVQQIGSTVGAIVARTPIPTPPPFQSSVAHYASAAQQTRRLPAADYYLPSIVAKYPVTPSVERSTPLNDVLDVAGVSAATLNTIYSLVRSAYSGFIVVGIALGLGLALFHWRRKSEMPGQYVFLGIACLLLVGAQVFLPSAVINYGLTRLIQQTLLVLALPITLACLWLLKCIRVPVQLREGMLAIVVVGFFFVLSGLVPGLTGGAKPALPLANDGLYYQIYYTHNEEVAAAQWFDRSVPLGSRVYSDEFMRRKLIAYANIFAQPTLVPAALPVDSYVMLDYGNTVFNQVPAYDGNNVIYYQPPVGFLTANKNLVYSSTDISVYK